MNRASGWVSLAAFIGCVPAANWLIAHFGTVCVPDGPCLIPVWPGILAPSGVLLAGLSFVLRDLVQEALGVFWAIAAVLIGGLIAAFIASPVLAVASVTAFLFAETVDLLVFSGLRRRGLVLASVTSSVIGLLLDSLIFVQIAFGGSAYIVGQSIGKAWMILAALPLLIAIQRARGGAADRRSHVRS
ncbi:beta-carotene 15,15'-monooxygenase [Aminobacter sp. DSM 101952]|nr:beta-carotene 15,15'-monooxygenase [Aminobacter sp. DSM 101952]